MNEDAWLDAYWEDRLGAIYDDDAGSYFEAYDLDAWADEDDEEDDDRREGRDDYANHWY